MVDLRAVKVFCTVVEARSLTAAGERLRISQPAVSKQVRAFETWCRTTLFERSRSGVSPTQDGLRVYAEAKKLLEEAERFGRGVEEISGHSSGRLRICSSYTIGEYLLPGWIDDFQSVARGVVTELIVGNSETVIGEFSSGRADLCFIESGHTVFDFERVPVAYDSLRLVVGSSHKWAKRDRVSADELLSEPFVSRELGSGTRSIAEKAFAAAGLEPPLPSMELASTAAIKRALSAGHGYALLSGLAVRDEVAREELTSPELPDLDLRRSLDLLLHTAKPLSSLAEKFVAMLKT